MNFQSQVKVCGFICILSFFSVHPAVAQAPEECSLSDEGGLFTDPINATSKGGSMDGAGGIDLARLSSKRTVSPRAAHLISFEILDIRDDLFTTLVVDAEMIETAQRNEIEVISDWFDQVILDPRFEWTSTVDAAFTGRLFQTKHEGTTLTLRTQPDTFVIVDPMPGLITKEGPFGSPPVLKNRHLSARPVITTIATGEQKAVVTWDEAGIYDVNLVNLDSDINRIELNAKNGLRNVILMNLKRTLGTSPFTYSQQPMRS